ncbi:DUF5681 domain-containing protein [Psychromarinibacter halotolerans]|uniref:DUF5681 domain-containing protein n=1 Tax=Psychromarinibacter halotolerans TaxID=1775175 RepID=A0ABV7GTJ1_9RHOB|nr:DUF5681 domain-containing protein [Psychromarinibacter halotolerans]MDF0596868.1 DUF5681 domain-containing protein [Psychromarinibacter halotolerans]
MTRHKDDGAGRALQVRPSYDVGYGKPPKDTRFKPGQSGNPRGRPKGAKNKHASLSEERLQNIILEEAYRTITVRDGDRSVSVPMAQAVIRSLAVNAAKGQHRAQRLFSELLSAVESSRRDLQVRFFETAVEYKVEWERELARRQALGVTDLPPPLPHPDHVVVDVRSGSVRIVGPATREEKAIWDEVFREKEMLEDCIAQLRSANETATDPAEIQDNLKFIEMGERKLADLNRVWRG